MTNPKIEGARIKQRKRELLPGVCGVCGVGGCLDILAPCIQGVGLEDPLGEGLYLS